MACSRPWPARRARRAEWTPSDRTTPSTNDPAAHLHAPTAKEAPCPMRREPGHALAIGGASSITWGRRRARSSAGEHYVDIVGVAGSIPAAPTTGACRAAGIFRLTRGSVCVTILHSGQKRPGAPLSTVGGVFRRPRHGCAGARSLQSKIASATANRTRPSRRRRAGPDRSRAVRNGRRGAAAGEIGRRIRPAFRLLSPCFRPVFTLLFPWFFVVTHWYATKS